MTRHKTLIIISSLFLLLGTGAGYGTLRLKSSKSSSTNVVLTESSQILANVKGAKTTSTNYPSNNYFPKSLMPKFSDDLGLSAQSYAALDRDTGELLLMRNFTQEHAIASLTKIMTAIIALEHYVLDAQFKVSESAAHIGEASMGLTKGEILTVRELLYGLLLPSGNDAAETLAQQLLPDENENQDLLHKRRDWFIEQMNRKAQELGMQDTYFVNPTGLDEKSVETSTFSTSLDLLALSNYALNNPTFAKFVATEQFILPYKANYHKALPLYNILELDASYKGIRGIKPGTSDFAGETLASYLDNGQRKIIVILLESTATKGDAVVMYDFLLGKSL